MARKVLLENEVDPTEFVMEGNLPDGTLVKDRGGDAWWKTREGWLYLSRKGYDERRQDALSPLYSPYTVLSPGGAGDEPRQWED